MDLGLSRRYIEQRAAMATGIDWVDDLDGTLGTLASSETSSLWSGGSGSFFEDEDSSQSEATGSSGEQVRLHARMHTGA